MGAVSAVAFDTLEYFEKLKGAGFTEAQARVQVEAMHGVVDAYDTATRKELATKGDIQDVRTEIQDVRAEIQNVRAEIQDVRMELKTEIADTKHEILKWVLGIALAQTAVIVAVIGVAIALVVK